MKRIKYSFWFLTIVCVVALFTKCKSPTSSVLQDEKIVVMVTTAKPSYQNMNEYIHLNGVTIFQKKENLRANNLGFIASLKFKQNDFIKSGQVFCTIKTKEQEALKKISLLDSSLSKFQKPLLVFSNVSGFINTINNFEGDYVGEGEVLATVSDPTSLVVQVNVPYEYNKFVTDGTECEIVLPDETTIFASISGMLPSVDVNSQSQSFFIRMPNSKIPENLNVVILVSKNKKSNLLCVPTAAIQTDEMQKEFWVMKVYADTIAIKVPIKIGLQNDSLTEIISNSISINDNIILDGSYGLADSTVIKLNKQ